jgi:hypothetical protein
VPAETGSCIGSGMWIVGNIECKGQARPLLASPR